MTELSALRSAMIVIALCGLAVRPVVGAEPSDPAPPKVQSLTPMKAPGTAKYDRVTFTAAPKALPKGAVTQDWPTFLGRAGKAVSTETKLLKKFPTGGMKPVWELSKGIGYASPSIQGDYLVFPHRVKNEVIVECLHPQTGEKYWEYRYPTEYEDRYGYGSGPRASPVIDGDRVYLLGVEGQFFCLELATGRTIWERNINKEFKVPQDFFGTVGTPLLEGDLLIINVGAPDGPCVAAFNKVTGKAMWQAGDKWGPSYASPIPGTIHGQRRVFVLAGGESNPAVGGLLSIDPKNGKVDFEFPFRSKKYESVNASPPLVVGDTVMVSATYRTGTTLLKLGTDFKPSTVWKMTDREHNEGENEMGLHWTTPVFKDGYVYAFDGRNEPDASLVCVDHAKGKVVWRKVPEWKETLKLNGESQVMDLSTLRGNILLVDGRALALGELGHLLWLDLNPNGYKELDRTWLFAARETWALPVVSRGLLYVTQNTPDLMTRKGPRLLCYDLRGTEE